MKALLTIGLSLILFFTASAQLPHPANGSTAKIAVDFSAKGNNLVYVWFSDLKHEKFFGLVSQAGNFQTIDIPKNDTYEISIVVTSNEGFTQTLGLDWGNPTQSLTLVVGPRQEFAKASTTNFTLVRDGMLITVQNFGRQ